MSEYVDQAAAGPSVGVVEKRFFTLPMTVRPSSWNRAGNSRR